MKSFLRSVWWQRFVSACGPFLILIFVTGLFAVIMKPDVRDSFFSTYNFKLVFTQTVIVGVAALGMTLIIISGGIDLSVGSTIALTSVLGAALLLRGFSPWAAGLAAVGAGCVVGCLNGAIIAFTGITPFIVTLGMLGVARGAAKWLADNQTVNFPTSPIAHLMKDPNPFGWTPAPGAAPGVWVAIGLALLTALIIRRTIFGRHLVAIGSNEATARLCGIRTRLLKLGIYTLSGVYFGLAGVMQLSRLRQGDPSTAIGIELDVIAAVVIGGASLNGGIGSVLGSMVGALTMSVLRSGSTQSDWPNYRQEIIIGVVILLAVGLDKIRQIVRRDHAA